jgi:hypothetical protein
MSRKKSSFRIPGVSFSMNRALGITQAKQRFARATGIPTTRSGRQRKMGSMMGCGGCLIQILAIVLLLSFTISALATK